MAQVFYKFVGDQIGKPYDKGAIVRLALGTAAKLLPERDWHNERAWFCFENCMGALAAAGIVNLPDGLPVSVVDGDSLMFAIAAIPAPSQWTVSV